MGAMYFMGTREGKAKASGNSYWAVLIFRKNRFKSYEVSQCFVDEDFYKHVNGMGLALGTPISAVVDIDGQISDISVDPSFAALNLDQRQCSNPVQYATNPRKGG